MKTITKDVFDTMNEIDNFITLEEIKKKNIINVQTIFDDSSHKWYYVLFYFVKD